MIYFLRRANGHIKIGRTDDLRSRKGSLQLMLGEDLELLGTISERIYKEKSLHKQFDAFHVEGEWFEPGRELLEFIKKNAGPEVHRVKVTITRTTRAKLLSLAMERGMTVADLLDEYLINRVHRDFMNLPIHRKNDRKDDGQCFAQLFLPWR